MQKKRLLYLVAGILSLAIVITIFISIKSYRKNNTLDPGEVLKIYSGMQSGTPVMGDEKRFQELFSREIANAHSVDLFKFLQHKFPGDDFETHYREVAGYLAKNFDEETAKKMLELYQKYVEYEMSLPEQKQLWDRHYPENADDALRLLADIKKYREDYFGKELAEQLFTDEEKELEYGIKRNDVINDKFLYGAEKERQILGLQNQIFGKTGEVASMGEMEKYQTKERIYARDLAEATPEQQFELKKKFLHELYPPDVAERLAELEWHRLFPKGK